MDVNIQETEVKLCRKERKKRWWQQRLAKLKAAQVKDSEAARQETSKEKESASSENMQKNKLKKRVQDGSHIAQEEKPLNPPKKQKTETNTDAVNSPKPKKKKKFYVLFVGNIPYSAVTEDIKQHFAKCGQLHDVRLATVKETGKSRGFAYVEFKTSKAYKKGLELHHSELKGREINVEITSRGRGTSENRKNFLKRKNEELRMYGDNYD